MRKYNPQTHATPTLTNERSARQARRQELKAWIMRVQGGLGGRRGTPRASDFKEQQYVTPVLHSWEQQPGKLALGKNVGHSLRRCEQPSVHLQVEGTNKVDILPRVTEETTATGK